MKPRSFLPRRSKKKLAHDAQSGRRVFSTITKKTRITPKKRTAEAAERIYGPVEFREWLHAQPCMICLADPQYTEQAHAKGDGMGRKASWKFSFPACGPHPLKDHAKVSEGCHRRIHRVGVKTFERAMRFTLLSLAVETEARWRAHIGENA